METPLSFVQNTLKDRLAELRKGILDEADDSSKTPDPEVTRKEFEVLKLHEALLDHLIWHYLNDPISPRRNVVKAKDGKYRHDLQDANDYLLDFRTPLLLASAKGHIKTVKYLVSLGPKW